MPTTAKLRITTPSDREIAMIRDFKAPRGMVFDAFTKPELIKRWLTGPSTWYMIVCEVDLRVGGKYRYVWRNKNSGVDMGMGGEYREIAAPERIVATELFDEAWYAGEAVSRIELKESSGITTVTQTLLYISKETRDMVLKSPMESGVVESYDKLEAMLEAVG
jgi:uncharacterized protein YndB with AHSA1/START domain